MVISPPAKSHQRSASTSPRRAPEAAPNSKIIGNAQCVVPLMTKSCSILVYDLARFTAPLGRSLLVTGLRSATPHAMPFLYAALTTPAIFRTVLGLRGLPSRRPLPPHSRNRFHSRVRCTGVTAPTDIASSSGDK